MTNKPLVIDSSGRTIELSSGDLVLPADPTTDLAAATKQYVDSKSTISTANIINFRNSLMQFGYATAPASPSATKTSIAINFPTEFSDLPTYIDIQPCTDSQPGIGPVVGYPLGDQTASGFTAQFDVAEGDGESNYIANPVPFFWKAYGPSTGEVWYAPNFVASSSVVFATTSSQSVTVPTQVKEGDLLIALIMTRDTLTAPSGWSVLTVATTGTTTTVTAQYIYILTKTASSSDSGASVTFTQASSQRMASEITAWRNADIDTWLSNGPIDESPNVICPALTANPSNIIISIATWQLANASGTNYATPSTGWNSIGPTSSTDTSNQIRMGCAYIIPSSSATYVNTFVNGVSGSTSNAAAAISIRLAYSND